MNLHAEALLHCVLASREDQGHQWVNDTLDQFYPGQCGDFIGVGTEIDFGYVLPLPDKIIVAASGTIGPLFISKAWRNNCKIRPENGLHRGWKHGWDDAFAGPVDYLIRKKSEYRPFKLFGLSRGHSVSQLGGLWLREERGYPNVEHIGFNGPRCTTRRGYLRMRAAHLRSTRWYNPGLIRDPVDDLGVIGGKHYGLRFKLPDSPNNIPFMDHDYAPTCDALAIQMGLWGKPFEAEFCASTKRFCKKVN